jgi:hypothetical protein
MIVNVLWLVVMNPRSIALLSGWILGGFMIVDGLLIVNGLWKHSNRF